MTKDEWFKRYATTNFIYGKFAKPKPVAEQKASRLEALTQFANFNSDMWALIVEQQFQARQAAKPEADMPIGSSMAARTFAATWQGAAEAQAGKAAFQAGLPYEACPHGKLTQPRQRWLWQEGWLQAADSEGAGNQYDPQEATSKGLGALQDFD